MPPTIEPLLFLRRCWLWIILARGVMVCVTGRFNFGFLCTPQVVLVSVDWNYAAYQASVFGHH